MRCSLQDLVNLAHINDIADNSVDDRNLLENMLALGSRLRFEGSSLRLRRGNFVRVAAFDTSVSTPSIKGRFASREKELSRGVLFV